MTRGADREGERTTFLSVARETECWRVAAGMLRAGRDLEAALAVVPSEQSRWLASYWAGSFVRLADVRAGDTALVIRAGAGGELRHLAEAGATFRLVAEDPAVDDFVDAWLPGAAGGEAPWDLIVVGDGVRWGSRRLRRLLSQALAQANPDARVVVLFDRWGSPLRLVDRFSKGAGSHPTRPRVVDRELRRLGVVRTQRFGVLRSTALPSTAFDLDAPAAAAAVLTASTPLISGPRRHLTRLLAWAAARRGAGLLVPGWAVLGERAQGDPRRVRFSGRIASLGGAEARMLIGEPPVALESWHESAAEVDAVVLGLSEMQLALPGMAPALLDRPSPTRVRMAWAKGDPLSPHALSAAEVELWVERAATLLREMQERTRRSDGTVLVHGDYWIGNLLTCGDEITSVIDWPAARWGHASVDRTTLVESFRSLGLADDHLTDRLRDIVSRVFAGVES